MEQVLAVRTQPIPKRTPGCTNRGVQHKERPEDPWTEGLPENSIRAAGVMEEGGESGQQRGCEPGWTFPLRVRSTSGLMISCSG